jgi:hypothetical protein
MGNGHLTVSRLERNMDKVLNWVPQIFYDLIGRIVPGGFLLGIACLIFLKPAQWQLIFSTTKTTVLTSTGTSETTTGSTGTSETTTGISASLLVLLVLVVTYVVGSLLGGLSALADRNFWQKGKTDLTDKKKKIDTSYVYDYIQFHRPDIGSRLAKISAERHMCRVLFVGAVILIISYVFAAPVPYSSGLFWLVESGLVGVAIISLCQNRHLLSRSFELMSNNWGLIHDEKSKAPDDNDLIV